MGSWFTWHAFGGWEETERTHPRHICLQTPLRKTPGSRINPVGVIHILLNFTDLSSRISTVVLIVLKAKTCTRAGGKKEETTRFIWLIDSCSFHIVTSSSHIETPLCSPLFSEDMLIQSLIGFSWSSCPYVTPVVPHLELGSFLSWRVHSPFMITSRFLSGCSCCNRPFEHILIHAFLSFHLVWPLKLSSPL